MEGVACSTNGAGDWTCKAWTNGAGYWLFSKDIIKQNKTKQKWILNLRLYAPKIPHLTATPCMKTSSMCITDVNVPCKSRKIKEKNRRKSSGPWTKQRGLGLASKSTSQGNLIYLTSSKLKLLLCENPR